MIRNDGLRIGVSAFCGFSEPEKGFFRIAPHRRHEKIVVIDDGQFQTGIGVAGLRPFLETADLAAGELRFFTGRSFHVLQIFRGRFKAFSDRPPEIGTCFFIIRSHAGDACFIEHARRDHAADISVLG